MDLSKIVNIPGKAGIFKLVSQSKSPIVESLLDGKRFPVFDTNRVSALSDISIYTENEDKHIVEVFRIMFEKNEGKKFDIDEKKLKAMFAEILPDYDTERVYESNIKKVFQWYNILVDKGLVDLELAEYEKEPAENKRTENKPAEKTAEAAK